MDEFKRFFSEPRTLTILISSGIVGLFAGITQGVIQRRHGGWSGFFSSIFRGVMVSLIVGLAIESVVPSETMRLAIVGACAVVSEDIMAGLKALGRSLSVDPLGFIVRVLDAVRGRPTSTLSTPMPPAPSTPPQNEGEPK